MDKASDVYLTITDNSIQTGGSTQGLRVVIPMRTKKGKLGLNYVTADTLEDVLGYDLAYNSNYLGLKRILETVAYAYVWRLNQNSTVANAYFTGAEAVAASRQNVKSAEEMESYDDYILSICNKSTGDWQKSAIKISPKVISDTIINDKSDTQTFTVADVNYSETLTIGETTVEGGCVIYDASGSEIIAAIVTNTGTSKLYRVEDGKVILTKVVEESSVDASIGTVTKEKSGGKDAFTVTLSESLSNDTFWVVKTIPETIKEWVLTLSVYTNGSYKVQDTYEFSTDSTYDNYYKNVDFGDLSVAFKGTTIPTNAREYFMLNEGSNGSANISTIDIDTTVLDTCECNFLAMNGITDYKVVNRLAPKCIENKIHLFADAPAHSSYFDVEVWAKNVVNSEYIVIGGRPDEIEDGNGKIMYLYPSVNYISIYAKMLNNHGSLNFPPAGATYGNITAESLIKCDYEKFANELKTNRINWQRTTSLGTMMWEQRTTYSLNSDLSYIAPVFIVEALSEEIVNFERNFNFRYMTRTDILNQSSGLTSILDSYVANNFLYSYELKMPTYEEAQKGGRTLTIPIKIVVMKDSEVIQINLELANA